MSVSMYVRRHVSTGTFKGLWRMAVVTCCSMTTGGASDPEDTGPAEPGCAVSVSCCQHAEMTCGDSLFTVVCVQHLRRGCHLSSASARVQWQTAIDQSSKPVLSQSALTEMLHG